MTLYAYTDGASRGNPGDSGIGIILQKVDGEIVFSGGGYIGRATNNSAEYEALIACLKKAESLGCTKLTVYSDSELMVKQMLGKYRIKNKNLQKYFKKANGVLTAAPYTFEIIHIEREQNREADLLANRGIDSKRRLSL